EAMAHGAQGQAEGRRRLAFALAGMDDQQALLDCLGCHHAVARGLALGRFLIGSAIDLVFAFDGHLASLSAARSSKAALARGRQRPRSIASSRRSAISRAASRLADSRKLRTFASPR